MFLCGKSKAKSPAKRLSAAVPAPAVELPVKESMGDVTAPLLVVVPKEIPTEVQVDVQVYEETLGTSRSSNGKNILTCSEPALLDNAALAAPEIGAAGVHGNSPPARNDSAATSCAGMTEAEGMSRLGTLQAENQSSAKLSPALRVDGSNASAGTHTAGQARPEMQQIEEEQVARPAELVEDKVSQVHGRESAPPREGELALEQHEKSEAAADGFTSRVHETLSNVKRTFSHGYRSLRSSHIGEGLARVSTGDLTDMQPAEQCLCGVLNDLTELGERALPCAFGEHADIRTEAPQPPMPQIAMIVDSPGGPYIRRIPDELVGDAINMGFITQEEVHRQREEWARNCGVIPIEYTPAISFAERRATA